MNLDPEERKGFLSLLSNLSSLVMGDDVSVSIERLKGMEDILIFVLLTTFLISVLSIFRQGMSRVFMDRLLGGRKGLAGYLVPKDRDACLSLFEFYLSLNPTRY